MELRTAASSCELRWPPRLTLATAGFLACLVTQSIPAMTSAVLPPPALSRTRTATTLAFLATPYCLPAMVPATWVPWPLPSLAVLSSPTKSHP